MTGDSSQNTAELFYDSLVQSYVEGPRFLRRDWLAARVDRAMAAPDCRFVLLTAAPGAGKTAFMAQLAHDHPAWPRYFIRRDQYTPLGDPGAHSFLLHIGLQLAALYPQAFDQEEMRLSVEQRIGTVAGGGLAVGAEIERIVASPFYKAVVEVRQAVQTVQGTLVGLHIGEWIADPRLIDLRNLQFMALIDPARALLRLQPDARLVILVDALDELRYQPGGATLLDWLAACPDLPSNVDLVLTSRPDDDLLAAFRGAQRARLAELAIVAGESEVADDVAAFARRLAAEPRVQPVLDAGPGTEAFVAAAVGKAQGNLGYLAALGRAVDAAPDAELPELLSLAEVPEGLDELHAYFLHRIKSAVARDGVEVADPATGETLLLRAWPAVYHRILGVLAVAREPLAAGQVRGLGGIRADEGYVLDALGRLQQFLLSGREGYRFYHATLADLLLDPDTRISPERQDLGVDPAECHARIAARYRGAAASLAAVAWGQADDYGLRYLPFHLAGAGQSAALRELLMAPGWLDAKLERPGVAAAIADYALAPGGDRELALVRDALRLSAHVLAGDRAQLPAQLTGRLLGHPEPAIQALVGQLRTWKGRAWLRPLNPGLLPAGSPVLRTLAAHNQPVRAVAAAADGRLAVSAADDATLRVWDVQSGAELRTLAGHGGPVLAVAVTADGRRVLSGSRDGTVRVWDTDTGAELRCLVGHADAVSAVAALDDDGRHAASGSYDGTIKVWDVEQGVELKTLRGHAYGVNGLAVLGSGQRVLSASYDHTLRLWDVESGQTIRIFEGHTGSANAVALAPDERFAVSASADHSLLVWDVQTGAVLRSLVGHTDEVTGVAVAPGGLVVSAAWDRTLRIWDATSGVQLGLLDGHAFRLTGVALIGPEGKQAISASWDTTLKVWDLADPGRHRSVAAHEGAVYAAAITLDGRLALSGADDGTIKVWDISPSVDGGPATAAERRAWRGHYQAVKSLAPLADSGHVLSWGLDDRLAVWDPATGLKVGELYGGHGGLPLDRVEAVLPAAIVRSVEPAGDTGRRRLILLGWESELGPEAPARRLALPNFDMTRVVDLDTGRIWWAHSDHFTTLVAGADGKLAVSAARDRTLSTWDLETGAERSVLRGHSREVWAVALSADGRRAVSVSDDSSAAVWDLETGSVVARFTADGALISCAISPDGATVIAADEAGRVHLLRVEVPG